jgi:hypothetical protein
MTKTTQAVLAIVLAAAAVFWFVSSGSVRSESWKEYSNEEFRLKLVYPESWYLYARPNSDANTTLFSVAEDLDAIKTGEQVPEGFGIFIREDAICPGNEDIVVENGVYDTDWIKESFFSIGDYSRAICFPINDRETMFIEATSNDRGTKARLDVIFSSISFDNQ